MTPQELKNSILQMAIQGKLVEQRPEEGTGEELYQQIQAEKQKLIKEKKIKKEKSLPEITEDEKPFEIPESWKWVRLGSAITLLSGTDFKPDEYNDKNKGIPYITGASSLSDNGVLVERWTETPRVITSSGDVLLVCKGSGYGKTVLCDVEEAHIARQIMAIKNSLYLSMDFIRYFLNANISIIKQKGQGVIPGIDRGSILSMVFPLPPLAEQKRIAAKIEELLPLIDRYEAAWSRLKQFNKRFPEDLQKSLLQQAIQGKLVERRPEEGTAEELYQQIQAEKQRLIAEKKIKKDKPLPEITEDEKPFDIPDSWKWVKLATISSKITDGEHKTPHRVASYCGYYLLSARNVRNGFISLDDVDYVDQKEFEQLSKRCNPQCGDILISCSGSVGRCAVICDDNNYVMVRSAAMVSPILLDSNYLMFAVRSGMVQDQIKNSIKQTAQANLFQDAIRNLIFPLPPLAEQKRIVAKLEELLPLCERLK